MSNVDFRVGDIVSFSGEEFIVTANLIGVTAKHLKTGKYLGFSGEGYPEHCLAAIMPDLKLKLVSRPKKMVKKTIERWVNVYTDGTVGNDHDIQADAVKYRKDGFLTCVKLEGSYECEEE
jgi:NMD protein affecting ribosome stability and mRNA decay